jgi:hypothetical protein
VKKGEELAAWKVLSRVGSERFLTQKSLIVMAEESGDLFQMVSIALVRGDSIELSFLGNSKYLDGYLMRTRGEAYGHFESLHPFGSLFRSASGAVGLDIVFVSGLSRCELKATSILRENSSVACLLNSHHVSLWHVICGIATLLTLIRIGVHESHEFGSRNNSRSGK